MNAYVSKMLCLHH